jgi:hypothetical protein
MGTVPGELPMLRSALSSFFSRPRVQSANRAAPCCRPTLEALEDRFVPSSIPVLGPAHFATSALVAGPTEAIITRSLTSVQANATLVVNGSQTSLSAGTVNAQTATRPTQTLPTFPPIVNLPPQPYLPTIQVFLAITGGGGDEPDYAVPAPPHFVNAVLDQLARGGGNEQDYAFPAPPT